ncbi:helix-turn-helix domain-containing protein [Coriobacterium glomerans]|uniref:helix-turn-helix domain-containing protein n=1 Tax=Coriobacterium glomerans TaxID=33871 RepID=UPI003CCAE1B6
MKAERARRGLSAKEVAGKIGVHENALLRWESGETDPLGSNLINLSSFYKCSPEYLLAQTEERMGKVICTPNDICDFPTSS